MSKSKVSLSAAQISEKWKGNMQASVPFIQQGIDNVTENPAEKAIAAQDKMVQNLTKSVQDGRWANGLKKVSLNDWKTRTKDLVGQRLPGGVEAAMPKRRQFDEWNVNAINGILPKIAAMPKMTIQDSVNRAAAFMTSMHQNRYKG